MTNKTTENNFNPIPGKLYLVKQECRYYEDTRGMRIIMPKNQIMILLDITKIPGDLIKTKFLLKSGKIATIRWLSNTIQNFVEML